MITDEQVITLLAGREAFIEYQTVDAIASPQTQPARFKAMLAKLSTLGFESLEAFLDFNEFACRVERLLCYKTEGECDGCKGRQRSCDPGCYAPAIAKAESNWKAPHYSNTAKTVDFKAIRKVFDDKLKDKTLTLDFFRKNSISTFWLFRKFPNYSPPGCSMKEIEVKKPRFDLFVGTENVAIPLDPATYEANKLRWAA